MNRLDKIAIAQAICAGINARGGIGPFGGEAAEYDEDYIGEVSFRFATQCCDDIYKVEDDLTITHVNAGEAYERIKSNDGLSDEDMIESYGTRGSYIGRHDHQKLSEFLGEFFYAGNTIEIEAMGLCMAIAKAKSRK
jgi:hypothetical protein